MEMNELTMLYSFRAHLFFQKCINFKLIELIGEVLNAVRTDRFEVIWCEILLCFELLWLTKMVNGCWTRNESLTCEKPIEMPPDLLSSSVGATFWTVSTTKRSSNYVKTAVQTQKCSENAQKIDSNFTSIQKQLAIWIWHRTFPKLANLTSANALKL